MSHDEHIECDRQLKEAEDKIKRLRKENQSFGNVLAVVHKDGGHNITKHGHHKASRDAIKVVLDLRAENELLRKVLQGLYDEQNGPPLLWDEKGWQAMMDKAEKLLEKK